MSTFKSTVPYHIGTDYSNDGVRLVTVVTDGVESHFIYQRWYLVYSRERFEMAFMSSHARTVFYHSPLACTVRVPSSVARLRSQLRAAASAQAVALLILERRSQHSATTDNARTRASPAPSGFSWLCVTAWPVPSIRTLFYFLRPFLPLPFALPVPVPVPVPGVPPPLPPPPAPSARTLAGLTLMASPPSSLTV